jgi:hypothetical protein
MIICTVPAPSVRPTKKCSGAVGDGVARRIARSGEKGTEVRLQKTYDNQLAAEGMKGVYGETGDV